MTLETPLRRVHGVGPERAAQLHRLQLVTASDLLLHRPRRYEDRRHFRSIAGLELGQAATVRGQVVALGLKRYRHGSKSVFELILDDGTARLHCRWWNLPFMQNYFAQGDEVFVFGRPNSLKPRTMDHPETEVIESGENSSIHINRVVPVYPLTEGLPQRWLRSLIWRVHQQTQAQIAEPWPQLSLPDWPSRAQAIQELHFPEETAEAERARQRLALDEFIDLQVALRRRRIKLEANARALPCAGDNQLIKPFLAGLGFTVNHAQTRVLREIRTDLGGRHPMRRLVQGDVGAGKTVVAACSILMTIESGFSAALMAPTEILAEQHFQNFKRWFEPLGVPAHLRTGSRKETPVRPGPAEPGLFPQSGPAAGAASLTIGTHALLTESFALENLGLVVIDEQHKFGVSQREQLVRKGQYPHLLVMTATPIPRTLGMTLYGDLDISVIDELPAGRGQLKTFVRGADKLPKVLAFIRQKLDEGRQAYVVYPRVEQTDLRTGLKAVMQEHARLQEQFAPHRVGLLHGRLRGEEKEAVMAGFRSGQIHVLLATSVVEVGVDVPNATVMLIENAGQFGLAQLHQLRGRIGRGAHEAHCILVADLKTADARQRLQILESTSDGFAIAEADLRLRGPGEFLGQEQSGLPPFRFGDLAKDSALVEKARELARTVV